MTPNDGAPRVVEFDTRKTEWIRFQMTDGEGQDLGLSEIEVYPAPESLSGLYLLGESLCRDR